MSATYWVWLFFLQAIVSLWWFGFGFFFLKAQAKGGKTLLSFQAISQLLDERLYVFSDAEKRALGHGAMGGGRGGAEWKDVRRWDRVLCQRAGATVGSSDYIIAFPDFVLKV